MRVRVSEVLDPARELLARERRATFFFQREWANALRDAYPSLTFKYLVLEEDGRVTAMLPVVQVPHGPLREIVSMPFGTHGGVLSAPEASLPGMELLHARFVAMLRHPGVFRYELTAYDPPAPVEADLLHRLGRDLVRTSVPVLDLAQGEETLWNAYDQRLRRSVRRAEQAGVVAQTGPAQFETFFELYAAQSREWPLPWHHRRERLATMVASLGDRAGIWTGSFAGQPLCAQLVLYQPGRDIHFWLSGARPESRRYAAFHFLLNAIILDAARRRFRECHFGSSLGNPGVEHFKLAYGSVPRPLLRFFHQPRWVGWVQRIRW
jgi:GNAT acetyltransferase-like protein